MTINGKSWHFSTTHERQFINGRETHCGCYHDEHRILVDASLPIERQLEVAAKAALEIASMVTFSSGESELEPVLDFLDVPLRA